MAGVLESSWMWDRTGGKLEGLGRSRACGATVGGYLGGPLCAVEWCSEGGCGRLHAVQTGCRRSPESAWMGRIRRYLWYHVLTGGSRSGAVCVRSPGAVGRHRKCGSEVFWSAGCGVARDGWCPRVVLDVGQDWRQARRSGSLEGVRSYGRWVPRRALVCSGEVLGGRWW